MFVFNHHQIANMTWGPLLTLCGITPLEIFFNDLPCFFRLSVCSVLVFSVIISRHSVDILQPVSSVFLYFVQTEVIFSYFAILVFVLLSVQVYSVIILIYFICAAVILPASLASMVQYPVPYNRAGRAGRCFVEFYILVSLKFSLVWTYCY